MSELTAPDASALQPASARRERWASSATQRSLQALWLVALPGALAGLVMRFFVPRAATGVAGAVALVAEHYPLPFGVGLFLLFSALAHAWRTQLPGGARAWASPATGKGKGPAWEVASVALVLAGAAVAAFAVRSFVRPYRVLGASMLPTLEPDDLVAGRMQSFGAGASAHPRRGDVVVFQGGSLGGNTGASPLPDTVVKRVIGLPGDRVAMHGSEPVINGWPVPICEAGEYLYILPDTTGRAVHAKLYVEYLEDRAYLAVYAMGAPFTETYWVKPGEVFVLGDNRGNSIDSRAFGGGHGGGVPLEAIEARATRFLVGTKPAGDSDLGRFLAPVDGLHARLPLPILEGSLDDGVARCLADRPRETRPPAP